MALALVLTSIRSGKVYFKITEFSNLKLKPMKKPKITKETKDVLLELGIELLKALKQINERDKLKLPRKPKPRKGDKSNVNSTNSS